MKWIVDKNILIVGLGIIGGSYAMALKRLGYKIIAIDKNKKSIDYALQKGIIDEGYSSVDKIVLAKADCVISGLYPHTFIDWVKKYHRYLKKCVYFTDITGVKGCVVDKVQSILAEDGIEFIAAHPMAGREVLGVENSDDSIFHGANFIVTPTKRNTKEAIEWAKSLGRILGFRKVSVLSIEEHDDMIAFLSQMTHAIAMSLMTCKDNKHLIDFTGDSFRDLTRIATINEVMWSELFISNKEKLVKEMDLFIKEFKELRDIINKSDVKKLKDKMKLSTYRRSFFKDKKR